MRDVRGRSYKKRTLGLLLILTMLTTYTVINPSRSNAAGTIFYVDNAVEVSGDGLSWETAYKYFSDIEWSKVKPGDTIYISGGPSGGSKTYTETWSVGASGSPGLPITITVDGSNASHNGTVIFDYDVYGDHADIDCAINVTYRYYITISGNVNGENHIIIRNLRNILNRVKASAIYGYFNCGIIIENVDINNCNNGTYFHSPHEGDGIEVRYCNFTQMRGDAAVLMHDGNSGTWDKHLVHHNYIELLFNKTVPPGGVSNYVGPDGIQAGNGLSFYSNTVKVTRTDLYTSNQHPDGVQFGTARYCKIYNNDFINVGDNIFGLGSWLPNFTVQDIMIYNNICRIVEHLDDYPEYLRLFASDNGSIAAIKNLKIMNNLFLDGNQNEQTCRPALYLFDYKGNPTASGVEIRNNIFFNTLEAIEIQPSTGFTSDSFVFSNNIFYPSNTIIRYLGTEYDPASWISSIDSSAGTVAPEFKYYVYRGIGNDLHLSPSDAAARDAGISLSTMFTTDMDGVERPQGVAWDIGPYEFIDTTASPTPTQGPSPTPTQDPSPTPTQDPIPTPTQGPSPTPTQTPGPNPSTPGSSGGSTTTPAISPKPTGAPSPTPTPKPGQDGNTESIPPAEDLITTDYPEMVRLLELLYESANIRDNTLNPSYGLMMRREPVVTLTAGYQDKLRELAKLTFGDIRGDEWYASHIPLAVYRRFVKGFPGGTFKGSNQVTRAEVLTMLARFNNSEASIRHKAEQDTDSFIRLAEQIGNDWYTHYVVAAKEGLVYPDLYTRETILQPMTRGEVIYALANFLWSEDIRAGGKYYTLAESNETPAFNDTVKTIYISNPDAGNDGEKCYCWYKQLMKATKSPENGVPMDFYPSIICLKDKGILLGNNGDSKWNDPITRAEVLALFERLAKVWGGESK